MRQTSLDAYNEIRESGLLSRARWEVYDALFHQGPLTRNELDGLLAPGRANPPYSRRLTELEAQGVAFRGKVRPCAKTGFNCEEWDVNGNLPVKLKKAERLPSNEDLQAAAEELRLIYRFLRRHGHPGFSDNLVRVAKWMASR